MTTATAQLSTSPSPQPQHQDSGDRLGSEVAQGGPCQGARAQQQPSETQSGAASSRLGTGLGGEEAADVPARAGL